MRDSMILLNDFFKIIDTSANENSFISKIEINPQHIVFIGHFPGYPVTPGVIQIQIVHELLEKHFGIKMELKTMPQCKFLKILNPQ